MYSHKQEKFLEVKFLITNNSNLTKLSLEGPFLLYGSQNYSQLPEMSNVDKLKWGM